MSECRPWREDDNKRLNAMHQRAIDDRVPMGGYFALTHRCSLRCRHCYLGSQEEIHRHIRDEISFEQTVAILDQLAEAGVLGITFTGGEPLLHSDFRRIYQYAIKKGFLVTLMSNATLITDEIIELFEQYPPRIIEVSMYGATRETYEKVTQVAGSYDRFIQGIDLLHVNGIRFLLKSVLMKLNQHELDVMEQKAEQLGVKYRFDSGIFPALAHSDNGGKSNVPIPLDDKAIGNAGLFNPIKERISREELLEIDFGTKERQQRWQEIYEHEKDKKVTEKFITCFAALTTFHISPYGVLQPCMLMPSPGVDLKQFSFMEGWEGELAAARDIDPPPDFPCHGCKARPICGTCAAIFQLGTGQKTKESRYFCEASLQRIEQIKKYCEQDEVAT